MSTKVTNNKQNRKKQAIKHKNVLEAFEKTASDIGKSMVYEAKDQFAKGIAYDAMEQVFGVTRSGSIEPGKSIEIDAVISGKLEKQEVQEKQLHFQRTLIIEEERLRTRKVNDLRIQLKVIAQEVLYLAQNTQDLGEEVQLAAMQAPVEPGPYHIIFFESLLDFIKSFRQKISSASTWLHHANKRASRKNRWGSLYKKHGAKYLLSGEHYVSRSAG